MAIRWRVASIAVVACIVLAGIGSRVAYAHYRDLVYGHCPNMVYCPPAPYFAWLRFELQGQPLPT